jgi:tmRNA-binding protein
MSAKKSKSGDDRVIAVNRKARHDYFIENKPAPLLNM